MKKLFSYINDNKKPLSGIVCVFLYFIDSLFDITNKLCLAEGWYYSFTVLLFFIISYAIQGEGFKKYSNVKEVKIEEKQSKSKVILERQVNKVTEIVENKEKIDSG